MTRVNTFNDNIIMYKTVTILYIFDFDHCKDPLLDTYCIEDNTLTDNNSIRKLRSGALIRISIEFS